MIPPVEAGDEVKKAAGRGKRKGKDAATSENSPPKRTLRSNSKTSLVVAVVSTIFQQFVNSSYGVL